MASTPVPLISWEEGLCRKALVTSADNWTKLALTLDGRDKLTKVLQYTARLLVWWFAGKRQAERFQNLKDSLTKSRKAFRIGRSLIEWRKIMKLGLRGALAQYLSENLEGRNLLERTAYQLCKPEEIPRNISNVPLYKIIGTAMKTIGLLGFWFGDNIVFLTSSGLLDNYQLPLDRRLKLRKSIVSSASKWGSSFYFIGALASLLMNLRTYREHRQKVVKPCQEAFNETQSLEADKALFLAKQDQFVHVVVLTKSICDVLVFGNLTKFWKKSFGRPLPELLHCIAGLTSASTVLYNNFPNDMAE